MVALIIVVLFAIVRSRLSVDKPGKLQQTFRTALQFPASTGGRNHRASRWAKIRGIRRTMFIFVLFGNLIGVIPSLESPTMFAPVPLGCAMATFLAYNLLGVQAERRRVPEAFHGSHSVACAADDSDRNHQPSCAPAVAHDSSLRQHAGGRKGDARVFIGLTYLRRAGRVHGTARIRIVPAGLHLHGADDDLRRRRGAHEEH